MRYSPKLDQTQNLMKVIERLNDVVDHVKAIESILESKLASGTAEFKQLRSLFFERYAQKALQITGKFETPEGQVVAPAWNGKEGALLKHDLVAHGAAALTRYMEYFFSDQVNEVAEFTRHKAKAGYGYSVFHGVIPKLTLYTKKPFKPCGECGRWGSHNRLCSKYPRDRKGTEFETVDAIKNREETSKLDITGMFEKKVNA